MKNMLMVVMFALLSVLAFAGSAQAETAYAAVTPRMDGNECVIPSLPNGAKLLNVQLYNDSTGARPKNLGPVNRFPLKPGEGFNFTWEGGREGVVWQLITPRSVAGHGLRTVCFEGSRPDCKYERPL